MKTNRWHSGWLWCLAAIACGKIIAGMGAGAAERKEKQPPEWHRRISLEQKVVYPWDRGCEATFVLSWNGVLKAGEVTVAVEGAGEARKGSSLITANAQGESAGLARIFWNYKCELESLVDLDSMHPRELVFLEEETRARTRTTARFSPGAVVCTRRVEKTEGGEPEVTERKFEAPRIHDLASAILYLRGQPLKQGDEIRLVVYPFDNAYLTTFRVLEREPHRTELGEHPSIKLEITIDKIHKDQRLERYDKFKHAYIWVSDDEYRLPLEIRAEIFVGSVRATMTERRFTGEAKTPAGPG